MSAEHSPLPWRASNDPKHGGEWILDANGGYVVETFGADAALIVHRVNTWEGLRDALRPLAALAAPFAFMRDDLAADTFVCAVNGTTREEEFRLSVADVRRARAALEAAEKDSGHPDTQEG